MPMMTAISDAVTPLRRAASHSASLAAGIRTALERVLIAAFPHLRDQPGDHPLEFPVAVRVAAVARAGAPVEPFAVAGAAEQCDRVVSEPQLVEALARHVPSGLAGLFPAVLRAGAGGVMVAEAVQAPFRVADGG